MGRELKIHAVKDSIHDNLVHVHWCIDDQPRQRIIHLNIENQEDQLIIAELCAIDFIVRQRIIFGSDRVPKEATVYVTYGAIKRLWKQETEKTNLIPWGRFLFPTLGDGQMETSKSTAWVRDYDVVEEIKLNAREPNPVTVRIPLWGIDATLTRHAIERYQERREAKSVAKTIAAVQRLISSGATRELNMSENRRFAKAMKHGKTAKYLINTHTSIVFVIVPEGNSWALVTIIDGEMEGGLKHAVLVGGRVEYRY